MFHPVNTYHILTRISKYLSKLVKLPRSFEKSLSNLNRIESQAAQGLINVQEYHDIDVMDIANGNINGYQSVSNMTSSELYFITKTSMKNTDQTGIFFKNSFYIHITPLLKYCLELANLQDQWPMPSCSMIFQVSKTGLIKIF